MIFYAKNFQVMYFAIHFVDEQFFSSSVSFRAIQFHTATVTTLSSQSEIMKISFAMHKVC